MKLKIYMIVKFINKFILIILTMIETIRVSSRGQVVIPESMRKDLHIKEGTKLIAIERGKELILKPEKAFFVELENNKEKQGWLALAERSLAKIWDNPKDDKVWAKYL